MNKSNTTYHSFFTTKIDRIFGEYIHDFNGISDSTKTLIKDTPYDEFEEKINSAFSFDCSVLLMNIANQVSSQKLNSTMNELEKLFKSITSQNTIGFDCEEFEKSKIETLKRFQTLSILYPAKDIPLETIKDFNVTLGILLSQIHKSRRSDIRKSVKSLIYGYFRMTQEYFKARFEDGHPQKEFEEFMEPLFHKNKDFFKNALQLKSKEDPFLDFKNFTQNIDRNTKSI